MVTVRILNVLMRGAIQMRGVYVYRSVLGRNSSSQQREKSYDVCGPLVRGSVFKNHVICGDPVNIGLLGEAAAAVRTG